MQRRLVSLLSLTLSLAVVGGSSAAYAQAPGQGRGQGRGLGQGRFGGAQFSVLRLSAPQMEALKITPDQKTKLEAIQMKMRTELQGLLGQGAGGDRQAAFQKIQEVNQKAEAEALALLTADQKKVVEAMKADAQAYAGLGRSGLFLLSVTGITDDQKTKLKALAGETQTKRQAMLQELRGGGGDRQALGQKMQAMETETTTAMKKILTEAQGKQLDAAVAAAPRPGQGRGRRPGGGNPPR